MTSIEAIEKVQEIIRNNCTDPADELIKTGEVLIKIGVAIKGLSLAKARAVLSAARDLNDLEAQ